MDWDCDEGTEEFDLANDLLGYISGQTSDANYRFHVEKVFECIIGSLAGLRKEERFDEETILMVTSTDPSELTSELADEGVLRLNSMDVYNEYRSFM